MQSYLAVTFETCYRIFPVLQKRVYNQKHFYFNFSRIHSFCQYFCTKTCLSLILKLFRPESEMDRILVHEGYILKDETINS